MCKYEAGKVGLVGYEYNRTAGILVPAPSKEHSRNR